MIRGVTDNESGQVRFLKADKKTPQVDVVDQIIIASRPYDSMGLLGEFSDLASLMSQAVSSQFVTSFAFRAQSVPQNLPSTFAASIYPETTILPRDGTMTAIAKDFADSNIAIAIGYSNSELASNEEQGIEKATSDLAGYGMPVSESIGYRSYRYPSVPDANAVADDWFDKVAELQGINNMFVVGEALSGYGVPAALNFVEEFYDTYFANDEE